MPRGTKRGKIAAFGWSQVTSIETVEGMDLATYPDVAAFEALWTQHLGSDAGVAAGVTVSNITTSDVQIAFNGGAEGDDAYYERTFTGLAPGYYDVIVPVTKGSAGSGFNLIAMHCVEVDGAPLGGGVPNGMRVALRHRVFSDGSVNIKIGEWGQSVVINGTIFVGDIIFRSLDSVATPKLLAFRLDGSLAWNAPKEGSRNRRSEYGLGALYELPGVDYFLRGTARRIPQTAPVGGVMDDGATITGWDDADGWQDFLVGARDKQLLTFYPDATDLGTSISCYLVEPLQGRPDLDGPGYYQLPIKLVSSSPFDGY